MADENKTEPTNPADNFIKKLGYSKSLLIIFVIPFILLFKTILKTVQKKPFFITVAIVCVLGWGWSMLLSYKGWWVFPDKYIVGIHVLPYLPLEEFIIYPIGGAFSIFFYALVSKRLSSPGHPILLSLFLILSTGVFGALAFMYRASHPYYLVSQLILYNGVCLATAFYITQDVHFWALLISTSILTLVGYGWDYLAFRYGWWIYNAIMGIKLNGIPIEDINFYLLAPTAAICLYVALCRKLKLSQTSSPNN